MQSILEYFDTLKLIVPISSCSLSSDQAMSNHYLYSVSRLACSGHSLWMDSYSVCWCVCIFRIVYHESALLRFQLLDTLWQNPEIVTNLASFHPSWLTSSLNCCLEVIFLRFHHSECWEGLQYINTISPRSLLRVWWRPVCIWSHSKKLYLGPKNSGNPVIGSVSFTNISLNSLSLPSVVFYQTFMGASESLNGSVKWWLSSWDLSWDPGVCVPKGLQVDFNMEEIESVSHSVVSDSLRPYELQPARLLCPWNSPGKNIGVGSHCQVYRESSQTRDQIQFSCIASRFFSIWATRENTNHYICFTAEI